MPRYGEASFKRPRQGVSEIERYEKEHKRRNKAEGCNWSDGQNGGYPEADQSDGNGQRQLGVQVSLTLGTGVSASTFSTIVSWRRPFIS